MLILPKLFIIEVYGLKDIFEKEPIYIIFRESDGVILSHAYDLQGASSKLKSLLEKNNCIPDDVINNWIKKNTWMRCSDLLFLDMPLTHQRQIKLTSKAFIYNKKEMKVLLYF